MELMLELILKQLLELRHKRLSVPITRSLHGFQPGLSAVRARPQILMFIRIVVWCTVACTVRAILGAAELVACSTHGECKDGQDQQSRSGQSH